MSLVKWSPFREVETLHREMDRLFSRFGGFGGFNYGEAGGSQSWLLPMDVLETQDALKLRASLPGIDAQDINVEVNDNVLTVSGERRFEDKVAEGDYHWIEQQYGTFSRSVTLPKYADADKIEARYYNGVLELTIPKRESAKPRKIELKSGETTDTAPKAIETGTGQSTGEQTS
ncbi:MAG: Hsp20/alpha crystallin family protein [Armatimonadota bacterium]|nr:Hsp20/alpha crystallin family protein [Armatimonadota bacterium]